MLCLSKMSVLHEQAILDKDCLLNCYATCDRIRNRGNLTLVSKPHFKFGLKLMEEMQASINKKALVTEGNGSVAKSWERTTEKKELFDVFSLCEQENASVDAEAKRKTHNKIVRKAHNSRTGKEVKSHDAHNTSRFSKKGSTVQFRTDLKSQANKTATTTVENIKSNKKKLEK